MSCRQSSIFYYYLEIENELKNDLKRIESNGEHLNETEIQTKLNELLLWLRGIPKFTTIRVNTLISSSEIVESYLNKGAIKQLAVSTYPNLPELIIIGSEDSLGHSEIAENAEEAIVDASCGAAVLRGAHVFAPGVMGLTFGAKIGNEINVYADIDGHCKKGMPRIYESPGKIFLGNGTLEQSREEIFLGGNKGRGIAIRMTKTTSGLPQVGDDSLPEGSGLLQNLPSIVCSRILDPQAGETILDMCAAPGNKTTHLSALMNNQGALIALEKVKSKISRLERNCKRFGCTNVRVFCFDSTNSVALEADEVKEITEGPPFQRECFDRILLDGPCSVLGKRPQLLNKIRISELRSFVSLQRKLFAAAVDLLKPGGVLVYSTCTITIAENEGIVSWALKKFPCLQLSSAREKYKSLDLYNFPGSPGFCIQGLCLDESNNLLRFGPESDTVGFFIAAFTKTMPVGSINK